MRPFVRSLPAHVLGQLGGCLQRHRGDGEETPEDGLDLRLARQPRGQLARFPGLAVSGRTPDLASGTEGRVVRGRSCD